MAKKEKERPYYKPASSDEKPVACPFKEFRELLDGYLERTKQRYGFLVTMWATMPVAPSLGDNASMAKKSLIFTDDKSQRTMFSLDDPSCLKLLGMVDITFRADEFWAEKTHAPFLDIAVLLTVLKRVHETGRLEYDMADVMRVKERYGSELVRTIGGITEISQSEFVRIYTELVAYDCPSAPAEKNAPSDGGN